jgi:capsular exopolysaccharide synthesis family protein
METIDTKRFISPNVQVKEAYKTLRNNILYFGSDMKIIGLISCDKEEGKSIVPLNIAISMAEAGKKVILIDADRCNSDLCRKEVDSKLEIGLSDYLIANKPLKDVICHTDMENLQLILSDTILLNFYEIPRIEKFSELMKELSETYDYIFLITPSMDTAMDMTEVLRVCDGIVLVVKASTVSYQLVRRFKTKLELLGRPILGAVLIGGLVWK